MHGDKHDEYWLNFSVAMDDPRPGKFMFSDEIFNELGKSGKR